MLCQRSSEFRILLSIITTIVKVERRMSTAGTCLMISDLRQIQNLIQESKRYIFSIQIQNKHKVKRLTSKMTYFRKNFKSATYTAVLKLLKHFWFRMVSVSWESLVRISSISKSALSLTRLESNHWTVSIQIQIVRLIPIS